MSKHVLTTTTILLCLGGIANAQTQKKSSSTGARDVQFLDDITITASPEPAVATSNPRSVFTQAVFTSRKPVTSSEAVTIESATALQLKYALLLDTEVEEVRSLHLFRAIDEWFGTPYRLGGSTKEGIDCSALMQIFGTSLFSVNLPRTAREQYAATTRITRGELREGDLVFFNTVSGVSHVGMYLQNNKFVHASSGGVTISDLYEDYWLKKFIGAGRF